MNIQHRNDFYHILQANNCKIGAELGVDRGEFSEKLNSTHLFKEFYAIDRWSDHHTSEHYFYALNQLKKYNVTTLRCTFTEAVSLFKDNYFDFIYIDGYAKQGQEGGTILKDWYPKLKPGGIFSGHDYHHKWSATVRCVDEFCSINKKTINLTTEDDYPSWWFIK